MNNKISNLNSATTLIDSDVLPIVNGSETKKVSIATLKDQTTVNADWNATSGKAQILNKPTIPTAVTQTSQLTNNGADGVNPFITALDIPTAGQASTVVSEVKNMTGATLTKGTVVYISGANGNKALVSKALATTDALSSRTFGMLQSDILNNGLGNCVIIGNLTGLNTSTFAEGDQLYLSGVTAGTYTATKTLAPTHLVYVGKVTRSHPTQGQIEVAIQNGYELEEIHDVAINGSLLNNDLLQYESSTSLWKNKQVTTASIIDSTDKRYQTENQNTFNDATSSIQTQLGTKADKSMSAYSFKVNNTNATANQTETTYKSLGQQTYVGTPTWTATTAPSGTTTHTYNWIQIGNMVTLKITLLYSVAGSVVTSVTVPLPSDAPTPLKPSGLTSASNYLYVANGFPLTVLTSAPATGSKIYMRSNSANNGFEISASLPSGSHIGFDCSVQYFTS